MSWVYGVFRTLQTTECDFTWKADISQKEGSVASSGTAHLTHPILVCRTAFRSTACPSSLPMQAAAGRCVLWLMLLCSLWSMSASISTKTPGLCGETTEKLTAKAQSHHFKALGNTFMPSSKSERSGLQRIHKAKPSGTQSIASMLLTSADFQEIFI